MILCLPYKLLVTIVGFLLAVEPCQSYQIGVGIADITGPAAEINMMGYAKGGQDTAGIHFRLYSRAFIVVDDSDKSRVDRASTGNRVCYVNTDLAMISQAVQIEVAARLDAKFGGLYGEKNVLLGATHTHSGPGGFLQYVLYIISAQGFIWQNFEAIVSGIVQSIERAHGDLRPGNIFYNEGQLLGASINRSPAAYMNNPPQEKKRYQHDTDKLMQILKFVDTSNKPLGMINWFAVHPTSMNNTNRLISGDNKGYAEYCFEKKMNKGSLPGTGPFVAAFANSNQGDVSPNIKGPRCIDTGLPCDVETSTCGDINTERRAGIHAIRGNIRPYQARLRAFELRSQQVARAARLLKRRYDNDVHNGVFSNDSLRFFREKRQIVTDSGLANSTSKPPKVAVAGSVNGVGGSGKCIAFGPGKDMFESTKIIGEKQCNKAQELWRSASTRVEGSVEFIHQFVDMSDVVVVRADNTTVRTCKPAMGYSFAAGTIDGPGAFNFHQGVTQSTPFWNFVRDFLKKPDPEMIACQHPKPILLATGEMKFPYAWQPTILPTQILKIGQILILGLPAEFTTMAGRRIRDAVKQEYERVKPGSNVKVILAGLANAYSSYVTTLEEYHKQRYEGASTIFGPYTHAAYVQQFRMLTGHLAMGKDVPLGPSPPNYLGKQISFKPGVVMDSAGRNRNFGDVIRQPHLKYVPGETVSVTFVAANPRNDLQTGKTFLTIEKLDEKTKEWKVVANDANWETKFFWLRTNRILGESQAIVTWDIPSDVEPGLYRIRHFGVSKNLLQIMSPYVGISDVFKVET